MEFDKDDVIIKKSTKTKNKYMACLKSDPKHWVHFGGIRANGVPYDQYRDSTPLKLYSKYDHDDIDRLENYLKRHQSDITGEFTAGTLSYLFLWS